MTEDFTDYAYAASDGWVEWNKGEPPEGIAGAVDFRDRGRVNGFFTADASSINWDQVVSYRWPAWGVAP